MKILHIVPTYLPAYRHGGPIMSVHAMNKWLVKKGCEVTVYTTDIHGPGRLHVPIGKEVLIDGVKVYYFKSSFPRAWSYSRSFQNALKRSIITFDLVHITSVFLAASVLGAYYAKKVGVPYIISPRGSLMKEPLLKKSKFKKRWYVRMVEKRNLAHASAIHFTSEKEEKEYFEIGLPAKKSVVIPNGLDEEMGVAFHKAWFRKKYNLEGKNIILSIGRINWKKGFDTLIPACAMCMKKEPSAVLVIAGEDEAGYKKTIEELIKKHNIAERVVFTGLLLGKEKKAAFYESDVFVLPSYSENFGMAVAEALAAGLPVIITSNIGIAEMVAKKHAGIVIEKNENSLAEAMRKVLQGGDEIIKMKERGKKLVEEEYGIGKIAEKMRELYSAIIQNP